MRQKFIDKIYMKEVKDKVWHLEKDDKLNGFIALKYVKDIEKPLVYYCNGRKYVGLDKGYSVLEYVPLNRGYNCRVFFDEKNRPLCFYFDINNGCGVENGMPWYDDLYLDVTLECPTITGDSYYIRLDDEAEFKLAKKEGRVDEKTFNKGYGIAAGLMQELREKKNDIVRRSKSDLRRIKKALGLR